MSVEYLETDIYYEGTVNWYKIDGEAFGITSNGKVLDSDGVPISGVCLSIVDQVAKYEAAK